MRAQLLAAQTEKKIERLTNEGNLIINFTQNWLITTNIQINVLKLKLFICSCDERKNTPLLFKKTTPTSKQKNYEYLSLQIN